MRAQLGRSGDLHGGDRRDRGGNAALHGAPRSAVAAGVASVLVAVVVSLVGAVAVFAQGVGCLN
jgi:hypothetical protein